MLMKLEREKKLRPYLLRRIVSNVFWMWNMGALLEPHNRCAGGPQEYRFRYVPGWEYRTN